MARGPVWSVLQTWALLSVSRAFGLRTLRATHSSRGRSPCNGVNGSWYWKRYKDSAEYYDLENATDDKVARAQRSFKHDLGTQIYIRPFYWEYEPERDDCKFAKMNKASFCAGMERHNLTRFFMVGDSISYLMAESFWGLVGDGSGVGDQMLLHGLQKSIDCPAGDVLFTFVRNDRLSNSTEKEHCGDWCMPWWEAYVGDERPTLLLANAGTHAHTLEYFAADFDDFASRLAGTSHLRPQDSVYFRLTLPGHEDCHMITSPYRKLSDFSLEGPTSKKYTWYLAPVFNDYVKQAAAAFADSQKLRFAVLDPYIMTILRPDGHRGDLGDCLHYYLPGVPDWWNHLLATELLA